MTLVHSVTPVVVNARMRNWIFVKVETDDGLVGWGEASLEWHTRAVVGALEDLAPLVIGEEATRTEHIFQRMYRLRFFRGGDVMLTALSGIDQALHDIKARRLGVPLYEILGGRVRDRVRMYDHLGGGESDAVYDSAAPELFGQSAAQSVADGFTALKILAVPTGRPLEGRESVRRAVELMTAVRDSVGEDVDIMVDLHGRTTPAMAIEYARALAPLRPMFLEEPCPPENVDALSEVAAKSPVPIAAGERIMMRHGFLELLARRAVAVIQPDVCHCGGIAELKKIAALAEAHYVPVAPHNPLGPIATAHNIHFALSTPNFLIQEIMRSDVPWRDEIVGGGLVIDNGWAEAPLGLGLGVEVDEVAAARYPYQPEPVLAAQHVDGAVADW